jgi:hypothetical protein
MSDYQIDRARWAQLSIQEQMGNIGSEVGRAIAAHRRDMPAREKSAIARALDLFNATTAVLLGTETAYRLKEILRARNEFLRLFYDNTFDSDADKIESYFMQFAFAARNER